MIDVPMHARGSILWLCFLVAVASTAGAARQPVELAGGRTEIRLNSHVLEDLGISVHSSSEEPHTSPDSSAETEHEHESAAMEFSVLETSALVLALPDGSYRGPVSGYLVHAGGFELAWQDGLVSLAGFELHPGLPPNAFELRAADGSLVFVLDNPHAQPSGDGAEFLFMDMDLRFSKQLAVRLGRPDLEGLAVGEAHVRARTRSPLTPIDPGGLDGPACESGSLCQCDFGGPVDILLESISSVSEAYHDSERVAFAPSAKLQNVGTADVPWYRSIAPDGWAPFLDVGQHPFLVMHLYRTAGGRIRQVGRSDLKHAFFSGNTPPCNCQSDQVLYNDCTDLYGDSTNYNRQFLAPRDELTASTGEWTRIGSHFDGPSPDPQPDFRNHSSGDHGDPFEHRLSAAVADLQTPGADYRIEAWYLVQGDIDIYNSMGHRLVAPAFNGSWTFPFLDLGLTRGSVLDTWVDPLAPPAGAANVKITTAPDEGELQLAVVTSTLPSGFTHYEYALMNFDFDRQVDSFSVPLVPGTQVQNAWFGDVDATAGNDWTPTVGATDITWQAPVGSELDWGTLFNFAFDANAQPGADQATLGVFEAGSPTSVAAATVAPATLTPVSEIEVVLAGTGGGRVTSLPAGIDCAGDCIEILADGVALGLSATANSGSAFVRWEEAATTLSQDLGLDFSVAGDRDLMAVFDACAPNVTLPPEVVSSPAVFHACESLTAGTGFEVASDVIFRAGREVVLADGFTVSAGASFRAEILPEQSAVP